MEQLFPGFAHAPNLHPMMVHFPIAFWVAATGAWLVAMFSSRDQSWRFGLWLHTLGVVAAAAAVGLGFWATEKMGHDSPGHDLVHVHRDLMLVAAGLALVVTALAWWRGDAGRRWRVGLTVGSAILLCVMTAGADRGAELVFRYGVGVAGEAPPHGEGHDHAHGGDRDDDPHAQEHPSGHHDHPH